MARARNIKPGLYKNEDLAECSILARYIFPGMWMLADREGRMEDRPKRIKGELLPYDNADVDGLLNELAHHGFILRYEVAGARYIQILTFTEHQTPHIREAASTIPAPDKHQTSTRQAQCETSPRSPDSLNPSSLNPESLFSESKTPRASPADSVPAEFAEAWDAYPKRPGASKADALKAWRSRIAKGASAAEILAGVSRYAAYARATIADPQYIKQPATFFGPGEHYKADWSIAQARASPTGYQTPTEKARAWTEQLLGQKDDGHPEFIDINDYPAQ